MFGLGTQELVIFGIIAVLLFGKRLPEVAKSLGGSYREFRKGLNDIQRQMDVTQYLEDDSSRSKWSASKSDQHQPQEPAVPKFELPEGATASASQRAADAASADGSLPVDGSPGPDGSDADRSSAAAPSSG